MSNEQTAELMVQVQLVGGDADRIDLETRQLLAELKETGFAYAKPASAGTAPGNAKAIDPALLGWLIVTVGPIAITKVLEFLHAWALRREGRVVKIKVQTEKGEVREIEVPITMSQDEIKQYIKTVVESLPQGRK